MAFQDTFTGMWGNCYDTFMTNTLQTELLTHSVSAYKSIPPCTECLCKIAQTQSGSNIDSCFIFSPLLHQEALLPLLP